MSRGYVIIAQNTETTDYIQCATALANSIKLVMPSASVSLLTGSEHVSDIFDNVIMFPYGDLAPNSNWKLVNDWQVYEASPYDETIKLEADLFIPRSFDHWWDVLSIQSVVVCNIIRNFKGEISHNRGYRRFIDDNNLPDVYNAITYFKKDDVAEKFFKIVRDVFENWDKYKAILKCNPQEAVSTDWAYAIACHIIGANKTLLPKFEEFSMVHMKQFINDLPSEDWTNILIDECTPESLRVNTIPQYYPFHYHVKSFSKTLLENYKWNKT